MSLYVLGSNTQAQNVYDYLILQDIGDYEFITQTKDFITGQIKTIPGYTVRSASGILAGAGHFDMDHNDTTYETDYTNRKIKLAVEVRVTQHAGSDSDKWLLHEVERGFRGTDDQKGRLGLLHNGARLVQINNNKVFRFWSTYRWVTNYVVVVIDYGDPRKSEPLEVVQAYLQKFPSTIPAALVLDRTHDEQWIKDEMERRLWLCDKWLLQLQLGKVEFDSILREVVNHMFVFLDYREKYYGIKARDEKIKLIGYLDSKDGTAIKNKLAEYKKWWIANKGKSIKLP
jgi:hypothetical protein